MSNQTAESALTLPQLLARNAAMHGDEVALQEKRLGIWQTTTWASYYSRTRRLAHGLAELGFDRDGVLAIFGDNRPEWVISELAAQSLGGIAMGIQPRASADELERALRHAGARIVIAEDQDRVDKLLTLREQGRLGAVERIVYDDPRGLGQYGHETLVELAELERRGEHCERERRTWLDDRIAAGKAGDVAVLCDASGTCAEPKLAMLTHRNLLSAGLALMEVDQFDAHDEVVSLLPLASAREQVIAIACGLHSRSVLSLPEALATIQADVREIGPRMMLAPPRTWERLRSSVQTRVEDAGWPKRASLGWALEIGEWTAAARLKGRRLGLGRRLAHRVAEIVALRPVREQLGLTRIRRAYAGGPPLGPDVLAFFHALGINLKQTYGPTEICGLAALHRDGDIRFETRGILLPRAELRIGPADRLQLRSPALFAGYYRNEEATTEALAGGWLCTGEVGYLDDGHVVVVDRTAGMLESPDGMSLTQVEA